MKSLLALCALFVTFAAVPPATAGAPQSPIVPAAVARNEVTFVASVDPSTHLRLQVVLPMRNLAGLRSLLDDQIYNPRQPAVSGAISPSRSSPARFGPTQIDYDSATKFFNANGLAVTHTYANRYLFQVEGGRVRC